MKPKSLVLTIAACLAISQPIRSLANIVGYVNTTFTVGDTLFENPLQNNDDHLSYLFPTAPNGTIVSLWDPVSGSFHPSAIFNASVHLWEDPVTSAPVNFLLEPGTGAELYATALFTNTFVGNVLNHDGTLLQGPFTLPPAFSGPNGLYLLGDKCPVSSTGNDIFLNILGRNAKPGEQYITLSDTYTYQSDGTWLKDGSTISAPVYNVGDAAFFNIGPVPEPSVTGLGTLALALTWRWRRRPTR